MPQASAVSGYRVEQWSLLLLLVVLALLLEVSGALWRWDNSLYDAQLRWWQRPASAQIVIIAIDDASLHALGRWPWPRRLHAQLLQRLQPEAPRAIALDIVFAQPDERDAEGDKLLAGVMREAGNIVLPIIVEPNSVGGSLIEILPLALLVEAAAGLGHVHVELDGDGIARRLYQFAGLGSPYWPHLSLVMLQLGTGKSMSRPVMSASNEAMTVWRRARAQLIPFAGPPGHIQQISYHQVLQGNFLPDTFRDKYVLIGSTAAGLGDALSTPVSGQQQPMAGVEINAQQLDALLQGIQIAPIDARLRMLFTALLAALPLLLFPRYSPRSNLLVSVLILLLGVLLSATMLWLFGLWYAPTAALFAIALSYPLWSWRRLEYFMRYLSAQLEQLRGEQASLQQMGLSSMQRTSHTLKMPAVEHAENSADRLAASPHSDRHSLQARIALVRTAAAEIRHLRDLIDAGLANMADGVLLIDPAGVVILGNTQAAHYLMNSTKSLYGRRLQEILLAACSDTDWLSQLDSAMSKAEPLQRSIQTSAGRDLLLQMVPLQQGLLASNAPLLIMNIADISVLKASERARNESLHFLSHDLRAPLVSMLALLEQARIGQAERPSPHLLEQLQRNTAATLRMAEQFLQLARAEAAEAFHMASYDLLSLVEQAADKMWASARQQQVRIELEHGVATAWVQADADMLGRALLNLMDNAIKHSVAGDVVLLHVGQHGHCYYCDVIDHGPGIPLDQQSRLFQRFQRLEDSGPTAAKGAGLGLVFVQAVMQQHQGQVELDSQPGRGARFRVSLPQDATALKDECEV